MVRPKLVCKSGLTLSVQASAGHYCSPKKDSGSYSSVEVGFPSQKVDALMEFAENPDNPTGTVYGYVPTSIVLEVIADNGGLVDGSMETALDFLTK